MSPLLATKLRIPPIYSKISPPERLVKRLASETSPLSLIAAPPGYGKTSLLASWANAQPYVAWYTISSDDNDPVQFWQYLSATLRPFLSTPQPSDLTSLLNFLHPPSPTILILDNYHYIQNHAIHQTITFLVEHLPPNFRLIISAHLPPALPLSRWRARGLLTELTVEDLRLTPEESEDPHLYQLTEGWPAGIQMAKNTPNITGAHPHFTQYFESEVLPLISSPDILSDLAILDTLTIPLCKILTDNLTEHFLEGALNNTPFIIPRNTLTPSYRVHPLFRDYLLDRLHRRDPARAFELHRRAWRSLQQTPEQAFPHAIAAQDLEDATRLLTQIAPHLLKTGRWSQLRHWLDQIPETLIESHLRLWITRVWLSLETYQQETIQPYLDNFDHILATNPPQAIQGELYAIRAIVSSMQNQPEKALEYARQTEKTWSDGDPVTGTYVAFALGAAYKMSFAPAQAEHWFRQTLAMADRTKNAYLAFSAHENLSDMLYQQARFPEAHLHALRAVKCATVEGIEAPFTGWVRGILGFIAFAWNELHLAQTEVERSIDLCKKWDNAFTQVRVFIILAHINQFRSDFSQANEILEQADILARQTGENRLARAVLRQRIHLSLTENNLDAARRWWTALNALPSDESAAMYHHALIAARLQLAEGQPLHALKYLSSVADTFKDAHLLLFEIERHILTALAHRALGKPEDAASALEQALHIAEPGKIQHLFIQSGAPMRELLRRLAAHSQHASFIGTLLATFGERAAEESGNLTLTHRETQILRLLAAGFSNRDMAEELVIADSTLKRHIANLYLKMGVHSRTQALACAQEFHLL